MMMNILSKLVQFAGIDKTKLAERIGAWSISRASRESGLTELTEQLRRIAPDISRQELTAMDGFNDYWELKRRTLQAFQCALMMKALESLSSSRLTVVDIGDSAGTHMLYLKELTRGRYDIDTIGVNLDPAAIEKIRARGQQAILCRAEDLDLGGTVVDLFTSFEMVEHLHNPALFFHRLAVKSPCNNMVITVPYRKSSRVGLHNVRNKVMHPVIAEEEHIFELSPEDWTLLLLHSGWKVARQIIYYQYPTRIPIISRLFSWYWKKTDYEGFWGAILMKDITFASLYKDWEA